MPECIPQISFSFQSSGQIDVSFDAPELSSDAGAVLLREMDDQLGLSSLIAPFVPDERDPERIEHTRIEQVRQRIYQMALGYEDTNDADTLRHDKLLKLVCDRDPNDNRGLSSQPTLCRLENVVCPKDARLILHALEDHYIDHLSPDTDTLILDVDGFFAKTHGAQQLTLFNGYYDHKGYFPLAVFDHHGQLVSAILRPGTFHDSKCVLYLLDRLIRKLKAHLPSLRILVRGDSHFSTPSLLDGFERLDFEFGGVDYLLGYQTNSKLKRLAKPYVDAAHDDFLWRGCTTRRFWSMSYQTATSWPHERHLVARAQSGPAGKDTRFVVTSLHQFASELLYQEYSQRGCAELRIKDFRLGVGAARLSCHNFEANWFRLLLAVAVYRLLYGLRHKMGEVDQQMGKAELRNMRLKVLKVACEVRQSRRRVWLRLPRSFSKAATWRATLIRLLAARAPP